MSFFASEDQCISVSSICLFKKIPFDIVYYPNLLKQTFKKKEENVPVSESELTTNSRNDGSADAHVTSLSDKTSACCLSSTRSTSRFLIYNDVQLKKRTSRSWPFDPFICWPQLAALERRTKSAHLLLFQTGGSVARSQKQNANFKLERSEKCSDFLLNAQEEFFLDISVGSVPIALACAQQGNIPAKKKKNLKSIKGEKMGNFPSIE